MKGFALQGARVLAAIASASWLSLQASEPILPRILPPGAVTLKAIPYPCTWVNQPKEFTLLPGNAFSIVAADGADLYNDCSGNRKVASVPMLLFQPDADFVLTAAVTAEFKHEFDGAILLIWEDEDHWSRILFEKSHRGPLSVCSAVTSTLSDDSMNVDVKAKKVWLRIARVGQKIYFYLSQDGKQWNYIRYFRSPAQSQARVGFAAQSPEGRQCKATFSQISYSPRAPRDMWTGE